jgi:hypothetical protein
MTEKADEEAAVSEGARRRRKSIEEDESDRAMARLEAAWRQELLEASDEEEEEEEGEWEGEGRGVGRGEEGREDTAIVATQG